MFKRLLLTLLLGASIGTPLHAADAIDEAFGKLPVLSGGRVKPLDTVGRTALLMMRGKQSVRFEGRTISASEWLMDMSFRPAIADAYPVFQIDDPDVLGLIGIEQDKKRYFTFNDLKKQLSIIDTQAVQAEAVKGPQRDRFQRAIVTLRQRLILYQKLQNTLQLAGAENLAAEYSHYSSTLSPVYLAHGKLGAKAKPALLELVKNVERYRFMDDAAEYLPLPGARGMQKDSWVSMGRGLLDGLMAPLHPGILAYARMGDAWRAQQPDAFRTAASEYEAELSRLGVRDSRLSKPMAEFYFNQVQPFYLSLSLYVLVSLLIFVSWIAKPQPLRHTADALVRFAFILHTLGLLARMWIQGRPPVTNLYSSAIFVGWAAVLLGILLERYFKNGLGTLASSVIGFITLIIAHHLAVQGDTLEMMRAVLDSNFWLATHVVTITTGYSSTFLAGALATVYLMRQAWDKKFSAHAAQTLEKMAYGVVCFSLFFSFVGTILGGIWADQSWGRFWGWDPKENGALMIVLWNAFVLHARVGGLARGTALMVLTVFGNVITAFSWFGVNMLGIGLHSYGFMDKAFVWLVVFTVTQLAVMALGLKRAHSRAPQQ